MNGLTLTPAGTATGPGWQHRLERDGVFSDWRTWAAQDYFFAIDPVTGGVLLANVTYWLYARHPALPQREEVASALQITETGRVVPVTFGENGQSVVDVASGLQTRDSLGLTDVATREEDLRTLYQTLMQTIGIQPRLKSWLDGEEPI